MNPEDEAEEDGANIDLDSQRKGKCVVLKTSTRQVHLISTFLNYFKYGWEGLGRNILNSDDIVGRNFYVNPDDTFKFRPYFYLSWGL